MRVLKVLVVVSVLFLIIFLYGQGAIEWPVVENLTFFLTSFAFLFLGYFVQVFNWKAILAPDYQISYKSAGASLGLFVFTKYIPGKVMVILGRAEYIKKRYSYPRLVLISRSFEDQLISIWTGLILGIPAIIGMGKFKDWGFYAIGFIILITIFLFSPLIHKILLFPLLRITKKKIDFPKLEWSKTLTLLPTFMLFWAIHGIAFYFLMVSVGYEVSPMIGFLFPLSATLGILTLIAPGGIGVREGILTTLLHANGLPLSEAASIAVFSRVWFLMGEGFLFCVGWLAHKFSA